MREIKYRGKARNILYNGAERLHNKGEWLYGDLIHQDGEVFIAPVDIRYPAGTSFTSFAVDPETIGQYTGLKDKNGVDIYEGDIVEYIRDGKPKCVKVHTQSLSLYIGGITYDNLKFCTNVQSDDLGLPLFEIVGNIHEKIELIKRGEQ